MGNDGRSWTPVRNGRPRTESLGPHGTHPGRSPPYSLLRGQQVLHTCRHLPGHPEQGAEERRIDLQGTLVLGKVALAVRLYQHTPRLLRKIQSVLQALEDQIPRLRPVPAQTQSRQRQGMCRVVCDRPQAGPALRCRCAPAPPPAQPHRPPMEVSTPELRCADAQGTDSVPYRIRARSRRGRRRGRACPVPFPRLARLRDGRRRVAEGGCPPPAPADPDVPNSGIRLLEPWYRYAQRAHPRAAISGGSPLPAALPLRR